MTTKYVIGIDAGGTKTAFALGDAAGSILSRAEGTGGSIYQYAPQDIVQCLQAGVDAVLSQAGAKRENVKCIAAGMPIFGEGDQADETIRGVCQRAFGAVPHVVVNDGVIGYLGALGGQPGINVVAGTGSIAFGMDGDGRVARCGGWTEHFSDEGSCYWLGKQMMALFCREADGRTPRGPLYDIVRETFQLRNDFDFVPLMEKNVIPVRRQVAAQQRLLLQAADAGDRAAVQVYAQAARELAGLAEGVKKQLRFSGTVPVSMTGGALHAMRHMEKFWLEALSKQNMCYHEAEASPVEGAVMLALKHA